MPGLGSCSSGESGHYHCWDEFCCAEPVRFGVGVATAVGRGGADHSGVVMQGYLSREQNRVACGDH